MDSEILKISKELGEKIKKSVEFLKFKSAKEKMDNDNELLSLRELFDNKKEELNKEISTEEYDKDKIKKMSDELRCIYDKINKTQSVIEFETSKEKLNMLIKSINEIIYESAYGKDSSLFNSCTGSCDSCMECF